MRVLIGLVFILVAVGLLGTGIVMAVLEIGGLYQSVTENPLDQPEGMEEGAAKQTLIWVGVGATGIVPGLIGLFLFKGGRQRRKRRRELLVP